MPFILAHQELEQLRAEGSAEGRRLLAAIMTNAIESPVFQKLHRDRVYAGHLHPGRAGARGLSENHRTESRSLAEAQPEQGPLESLAGSGDESHRRHRVLRGFGAPARRT